jgi:hypothetical protein
MFDRQRQKARDFGAIDEYGHVPHLFHPRSWRFEHGPP